MYVVGTDNGPMITHHIMTSQASVMVHVSVVGLFPDMEQVLTRKPKNVISARAEVNPQK